MPTGYRGFLAAFAGLALIGAAPSDKGRDSAQQAQREPTGQSELNRVAAAIEKLPQAQAPDGGCDPAQEDRQSDLCAQWKAADAAAESARWSFWTLIVGIAGLAIGGGTLVAAWLAARWAKKAADHTEAGATAADKAVLETRRIGEAQVRCYLTCVSAYVGYTDDGSVIVRCNVKNAGQSPAKEVECKGRFGHFAGPSHQRWGVRDKHYPQWKHTIAAGSKEEIILSFKMAFDQVELLAMTAKPGVLVTLEVQLMAMDVFDTPVFAAGRFAVFLNARPAPTQWIKMRRSAKIMPSDYEVEKPDQGQSDITQ